MRPARRVDFPAAVWQNNAMPLLSDKQVVRQLAALMQSHGVTRCVLCPGSRNAPLTATFSALFECRSVTDERSAGFTALGWAAQAQAPVAVCVTSGSALLNLHPSVAEAYYRNVPLLVISADRPAAWIGQQDGQTLPQQQAFGSLVRFAAQVPEVDAWHANRLINEALLTLHRGGPVHLNLPISEPFFAMSEGEIPRERVIQCGMADAAAFPRRLVLLGQREGAPLPADIPFLQETPVTGGHLSDAASYNAGMVPPDAALCRMSEEEKAALVPDLLITCGGTVVSKVLKQLFRAHPPKEHWHISPRGEVIDTFCCLTRVIQGEPAAVFTRWNAAPADAAFAARWRALHRPLPAAAPAYNAAELAGDVLRALPAGSVLHLANSSAVRYADLYPLPPHTQVECNRGVNGIEGSLSAAVGFAAGDARLNLLIIGDLSFFYDMNALWQSLPANLRILLFNNGGGSIFRSLPGIPQASAVSAPHATTATAWAQSCGCICRTVRTLADWEDARAALLAADSPAPVLAEVLTDGAADAAAYRSLLGR